MPLVLNDPWRETVNLPIPHSQSEDRFNIFRSWIPASAFKDEATPAPGDPGKLVLTCSDHEFPCQSGDAGVGIFSRIMILMAETKYIG